MSYIGDFALGSTIDLKFSSRQFTTGASFALTGGTVAAYVGNSTTEITAGITLTADFDTRTGLNHVRVVATAANGYTPATDVMLVLTAGTVDGVSVVGHIIGSFSIENRLVPGTIATGTAQSATAGGIRLAAATSFADNLATAAVVYIKDGTGFGQSRFITGWTSATDDATISPNWTTTPDSTSRYDVYASPPAPTTNLPDVNVATVTAGAITASAIAADAFTAAKFAADVTTEFQSGLATAATLTTVSGNVDAIKTATDQIGTAGDGLTALASATNLAIVDTVVDGIATTLGAAGAGLTAVASAANLATVDTVVDAIKAKTDSLTFTVANHVDANIQRVNDVVVLGDGAGTPWGP
jgi:hypothetical protein